MREGLDVRELSGNRCSYSGGGGGAAGATAVNEAAALLTGAVMSTMLLLPAVDPANAFEVAVAERSCVC